jgi:DNA-directed RNA polymerase specialized sigma24 family protein
MRNTFINQYRKSKRFSLVDIDHISPKKFQVTNEVEYNWFSNEVDKTISKLEPSPQEVLDFVRQGYSYVAIAEKLNILKGTVKSKIHFAEKT